MTEPSLGIWLRRERERRGITIKQVADQTKVAAPLLDGLESGDLSRWPGGIYRRAFVKAYAAALGLDADDVVKRFEQEHPPEPLEPVAGEQTTPVPPVAGGDGGIRRSALPALAPARARLLGTAADLTVAIVLALGSAAANSRLLWPVLLIAAYYAAGVLTTGTSPMVALLSDGPEPVPAGRAPGADVTVDPPAVVARQSAERRHPARRNAPRVQRTTRTARARVQ